MTPRRPPSGDLRERILRATRALLEERRFDALSVADVLTAAEVSRASFYFYFPSKQAVLAELVRRAVGQGMGAAEPWTGHAPDPIAALRSGVEAGAALWRANAAVLTAVVDNCGTDEELRKLWHEQMGVFTDATVTRINADPQMLAHLAGLDVRAVAASLTWLGERLYYLAAAGVPPFDDPAVLTETLTNAWIRTLYPV